MHALLGNTVMYNRIYKHNRHTFIHTLYMFSFVVLLPTAGSPEFKSTVTSEPSNLALDVVLAVTSDQNM